MADNGFESAWVCCRCYPDPLIPRDVVVATISPHEVPEGKVKSLIEAFPPSSKEETRTALPPEDQAEIDRFLSEEHPAPPLVDPDTQAAWDAIDSAPVRRTAGKDGPKPRQVSFDSVPELTVTRAGSTVPESVSSLPPIVDRGTLPGGRVPRGAVYVGRGGEDVKHPWICPFRLRKGTPEERRRITEQCDSYIRERLKKEPKWLEPLRGKTLVVYGGDSWAKLLRGYANA